MLKTGYARPCHTCGRKIRSGALAESYKSLPNKGLAAWAFFLHLPGMKKRSRKPLRSEVESVARSLGSSVVYCAACGAKLFSKK